MIPATGVLGNPDTGAHVRITWLGMNATFKGTEPTVLTALVPFYPPKRPVVADKASLAAWLLSKALDVYVRYPRVPEFVRVRLCFAELENPLMLGLPKENSISILKQQALNFEIEFFFSDLKKSRRSCKM